MKGIRARLRTFGGVVLAAATLAACNPAASPQPSNSGTMNASTPTPDAAEAVTHAILLSGACADASQQLCSPAITVTAWTGGALIVEFSTSAGHCSPVIARLSLDGTLRHTSSALGAGQSTGPRDMGPVSAGPHAIAVQAEGVIGGCNSGGLGTWSGTLSLTVSALSGANPTPRLETPAP